MKTLIITRIQQITWSTGFITLCYLGGIAGLLSPWSDLFLICTPLVLLLSGVFILTHVAKPIGPWISYAVVCTLFAFALEYFGVQTGLLFGNYTYGETLGFKLFDVPLIIGINWFIIISCVDTVAKRLSHHAIIQILIGALLAVFTDFLIEPVAIRLHYWDWQGEIPIQNYIGWFITSIFLLSIMRLFKMKHDSTFPITLFSLQLLYFCILNIFLK